MTMKCGKKASNNDIQEHGSHKVYFVALNLGE